MSLSGSRFSAGLEAPTASKEWLFPGAHPGRRLLDLMIKEKDSEAVWWRCHRRIIVDYLLFNDHPVDHLLAPGRVEHATPTPRRAKDCGRESRLSRSRPAVLGRAGQDLRLVRRGQRGLRSESISSPTLPSYNVAAITSARSTSCPASWSHAHTSRQHASRLLPRWLP